MSLPLALIALCWFGLARAANFIDISPPTGNLLVRSHATVTHSAAGFNYTRATCVRDDFVSLFGQRADFLIKAMVYQISTNTLTVLPGRNDSDLCYAWSVNAHGVVAGACGFPSGPVRCVC